MHYLAICNIRRVCYDFSGFDFLKLIDHPPSLLYKDIILGHYITKKEMKILHCQSPVPDVLMCKK